MTGRHLPAAAIALALVALLAAGCGGASSSPLPASTAAPTQHIAGITPTLEPSPTVERVEEPATPQITASRCADPYAGGAPYAPPPGQPLRLRPTGSAPPIERFQPASIVQDTGLEQIVRDSIGNQSSHFAVVIKNLADDTGVSIDPGRVFYPASLYKTWVMLEAFHQREAGLLDFAERYVISSYYEQYRLNDGELEPCSEVTAGQALHVMMSVSDNVAANLMYDRVGYSNVNQTLRELGLAYSGLVQGGDLLTTAGGTATLMEAIARGRAVSPAASEEMNALLESDVINDRLPALLPLGTRVAHKTGNWSNATHDGGIVFSPRATYVIVVLTDYGYAVDGGSRIARLSKAVYDYYNPS